MNDLPVCPRCGRCVLVGRCCPEPTELGWYMDGHLPWRLAVLDEAADIALERSKVQQAKVAALPRGLPERRRASRVAKELHITMLTIRAAREILAPRGRFGLVSSEQIAILNRTFVERASMQTSVGRKLQMLACSKPGSHGFGVRHVLLAMAGIEHERMNRTASGTSEKP